MTNLIALQSGTELVGDYKINRVLGAGGFGITYLADEIALGRPVTIKEYFPSDFAARGQSHEAAPRSEHCAGDYKWGMERFIEEAQTLAKFTHPNIVRVYRYFPANNTAYMVLHFEEGQSLKGWLKSLGRAPRQKELDAIIGPLLEALEIIHKADFLHRDIAPDNIIIRKDGAPVLIDFGSARGEIAAHSKTVSALVKPGYSPYEQYAETSRQQGPWSDIYALAATLYHAVTGKRPPDAPSRMVKDEIVFARDSAVGSYRQGFLKAIDKALSLSIDARPQSIAAWRGDLLAPDPKQPSWLSRTVGKKQPDAMDDDAQLAAVAASAALPPPDAPGPQGGMLDFLDGLKQKDPAKKAAAALDAVKAPANSNSKPPLPSAAKGAAGTVKLEGSQLPPKLPRILQRKVAAPAPAAVKALAAPVKAAAKKAPKPQRIRSASTSWRPLAFKLLIGVGVASGAVALQDRMPRLESRGASSTSTSTVTGSIASRLAQAIILPVAQLAGHTGVVTALAYTADGSTLVTAGKDETLRIWNAASASLARTIELDDGPATAIAVDGNRVLTGHANGQVVMWDTDRAVRLGSYKRNDAEVWSVTFIGAQDRFAVASHDWKIALWDTATTATPVHVLDAHDSAVQAMAFGSNGKGPVLVSGSADKTLKMWDLDSFEKVRTYRGHRDYITAVAYSGGGKQVASASLDGNVRIWSGQSNRLFRSLSAHQGRANALAFAPSGDVLASAGADGKVRVWDYKHRRTPKTLSSHAGAVTMLAFSPDGQRIASAGDDGLVRIWDNPVFRPVTN